MDILEVEFVKHMEKYHPQSTMARIAAEVRELRAEVVEYARAAREWRELRDEED